MIFDVATKLTSLGLAYKVTGTSSVVFRPVASLVASPTLRNGTTNVAMRSTPGDLYSLVLGLPADPLPLYDGIWCLDPSTVTTLALGTQGASGTFTTSLLVPNDAALRGLAVGFQGASYSPLWSLTLTNPSLRAVQ